MNDQLSALVAFCKTQWHERRNLSILVLVLFGNLLITPVVLAQSNGSLTVTNAYALGLLGLVTVGLVIYLFIVIFQPERF